MNHLGPTYLMIGGPFDGQTRSLPDEVSSYTPVINGKTESYQPMYVDLLDRRFLIMLHASKVNDNTAINAAIAVVVFSQDALALWQRGFPLPMAQEAKDSPTLVDNR